MALFIPWLVGTGIDEPTALWRSGGARSSGGSRFLLWQGRDAELPEGEAPPPFC